MRHILYTIIGGKYKISLGFGVWFKKFIVEFKNKVNLNKIKN